MTLNIGFIGAGGIAGVHLKNISKIEGARVAAVSDISRDRADSVGRQYEAVPYTDYQAMLDQEKLDAVYVCVPPFAHGDMEFDVIERGIPMLVEKPIATGLESATRILDEIKKKNLLTAAGYHWRYSEATNRAKAALVDRQPGMVLGYWLGGMPMPPWWRKMEGSGGQMLEQTTHIVDLARYLLGDITEVYAAYAHRQMHDIVEGADVPDVGSVTLKFENGAVGTISNACLLDQGYTVGLNVLTRDLILEVRGDSLTERKNGETIQRHNKTNPYYEEDVAFIEAVKVGHPDPIRSTYEDAYETHLVTLAANESAKTGKPIVPQQLITS